MNLGALNSLVLSWLDDPNGTYFTPTQTYVWLNNAQRECQKQLVQSGENYYVQKVSATMTAGTNAYALPTDFLKLSKLEIVNSGTGTSQNRKMLYPVTLIQLDQVSMSGLGEPEAYTIKKNCFVVSPTPQSNYVVYLHYSPQVADMVGSADLPDVPVQYHEYVAVLATLDGFIKDGRDMSQLERKKEGYLSLMKQDAQERHIDSPRRVIETDCEYGFGY